MDTMANLLVILFYLSALYTALGLLEAGIEGISRWVVAWRPWRAAPRIQHRPRRGRPRRRIDRDGPGSLRRPVNATKAAAQIPRAF